MLEKCAICPHKCGIDRTKQVGRCKSTDKVKIALYSTHNFEEPCISGEKGSGTIFFSNCNMNCIYCQNYEISQQEKGKEIINKMSLDYDCVKTTNWKECKEIIDNIQDAEY